MYIVRSVPTDETRGTDPSTIFYGPCGSYSAASSIASTCYATDNTREYYVDKLTDPPLDSNAAVNRQNGLEPLYTPDTFE